MTKSVPLNNKKSIKERKNNQLNNKKKYIKNEKFEFVSLFNRFFSCSMSFWCLLNSWFPFLDLNSSITTHLVKQPQSRPSNNKKLGSNAVYSILFTQDTVHLIFILLPQINVIFMKRDVIRREVCRVGFDQRNPKPETRNRLWRLTFPRTDRNPKPETRNPKPETRNRLWRLNFPRTDRNPKPETRNPKPTLKTYLPQDRSKPETRNPKPETDSEDLTSPGPIETRNPKPETDSEDLTSPGPIETRNPKPETDSEDLTSPGPIETRNPKPETDSESWFQATKPETRNPKPETDSNPTFGWLSGSELHEDDNNNTNTNTPTTHQQPTINNQQPQQEHEHEQTTTHIQIYSITFKTTSKRIQETKITTIQ